MGFDRKLRLLNEEFFPFFLSEIFCIKKKFDVRKHQNNAIFDWKNPGKRTNFYFSFFFSFFFLFFGCWINFWRKNSKKIYRKRPKRINVTSKKSEFERKSNQKWRKREESSILWKHRELFKHRTRYPIFHSFILPFRLFISFHWSNKRNKNKTSKKTKIKK